MAEISAKSSTGVDALTPKTMSISEATYPSSSSSHDTCNPSRPCICKPKRKPTSHENQNHHHDAASSSTTTTNQKDHDHRCQFPTLCKMIHKDLSFMEEALEKVKRLAENLDVHINHAYEKIEELQTSGSNERELEEFKKAIAKLKTKIPSQLEIPSAHSSPHRNLWRDMHNSSDEMMCVDPKFEDTIDSSGLLKDFLDLPNHLRHCLRFFFLFPPKAVVKRSIMTYLWKSHQPFPSENIANRYLDDLIRRGFIELVYQKCSLVPNSCRMSLFVWSALSNQAMRYVNTSKYNTGQITEFRSPYESCLINASNAIIDGDLFEKRTHLSAFYLGRWQSSATHHIEVADTKVLQGLKNMNELRFLSLRGISMITELPSIISKLVNLEILDLNACHNLEVVPDEIGSLMRLTRLDMSECYFLEYMPKSLGNLSRLEVLKGFFIGDSKDNKKSCTLDDLSGLQRLRKLNIYTSVRDFPEEGHLSALQNLQVLQDLTISWGGCSLLGGSNTNPPTRQPTIKPAVSLPPLPSRLQKLDLQCFHGTSPPSWLRLASMKELKKLYIRGGKLNNLKLNDGGKWTVKILRLEYMVELNMEWTDLRNLFPNMIFLHIVGCPKVTNDENVPCDENVVWKGERAIDQASPAQVKLQQQCRASGTSSNLTQNDCNISTGDIEQAQPAHLQLQPQSGTSTISSSSVLGSCPTLTEDDCSISTVYEQPF